MFGLQHAMLLPVLVSHLRFHECLAVLERRISYQFKDRKLLQVLCRFEFLIGLCRSSCK